MYKYGDTAVYTQLTRTNMNYGLTASSRTLKSAANKGVQWPVSPGDQIRFYIYTSNSRTVREIPSSGSATTNEWFWGAVSSLATNQVVKPIGATYDTTDNRYHGTIPVGCNYFVTVTASTTFVNSQVIEMYPVEKYVEGKGWIPIEPYIYDSVNEWQSGNTYKRANGAWS